MHPSLTTWKTLSRRKVLDCGKYLTAELHALELPDGRIIPDWSWIQTPEYHIHYATDRCGRISTDHGNR